MKKATYFSNNVLVVSDGNASMEPNHAEKVLEYDVSELSKKEIVEIKKNPQKLRKLDGNKNLHSIKNKEIYGIKI